MSNPGGARTARLRRRRLVEALSPFWATLALLLLYVLSIILLINFCPGGMCSPPDLGNLLTHYDLCASGPAWQQPLSIERVSLWPGRLLWVFFSTINVLACLVAVFVSFRLIAGSVRGTTLENSRAARFVRGPWIGLVPLGVLFVAILPRVLGRHRLFLPQVYDILNCAPSRDVRAATDIGYITIIVSLLPLACLVLASCVIIWPAPLGRRQGAAELARRMDSLRVLLYAGAAALVTTVLRISATFRWGLTHLPQGPNADPTLAAVSKVLENFATAFVSSQAGAYTIFLTAIYLPAVLVLRRRARALASRSLPAPEREEWLRARGLSASFSEYLPRLVAILGPFLAGPLGDLVGFLTK